jgi:hypothetical protein
MGKRVTVKVEGLKVEGLLVGYENGNGGKPHKPDVLILQSAQGQRMLLRGRLASGEYGLNVVLFIGIFSLAVIFLALTLAVFPIYMAFGTLAFLVPIIVIVSSFIIGFAIFFFVVLRRD